MSSARIDYQNNERQRWCITITSGEESGHESRLRTWSAAQGPLRCCGDCNAWRRSFRIQCAGIAAEYRRQPGACCAGAGADADWQGKGRKVAGGQVEGLLFDDVAVYRGIPYAVPPVDDLRWRAPQPVPAWKDVREASAFGKSCTAPPAGDEDCLYLNIYKPANAKAGAKLPVMFWIHGGGFTGGSGSQYDGTSFVKQGVVYVSINYRMGRAGWFAHPAITKNAPKGEAVDNFGLMDQIAALKWVQANIGASAATTRT